MAAHNNIRKLRTDNGLKQWHVGEATGYSQQQISRLEKGKRVLKKKKAELFALLFGVTVEELYANTPAPVAPAPAPVAQTVAPVEIAAAIVKIADYFESRQEQEVQMFMRFQEYMQQQMPKGKRRA